MKTDSRWESLEKNAAGSDMEIIVVTRPVRLIYLSHPRVLPSRLTKLLTHTLT